MAGAGGEVHRHAAIGELDGVVFVVESTGYAAGVAAIGAVVDEHVFAASTHQHVSTCTTIEYIAA